MQTYEIHKRPNTKELVLPVFPVSAPTQVMAHGRLIGKKVLITAHGPLFKENVCDFCCTMFLINAHCGVYVGKSDCN